MSSEHGSIILVAPNGATREEKYHAEQTVGQTLKHAVKEFAKDGQLDPNVEYVLVLNGVALESSRTLAASGVVPGSRLSIRSKPIPGDGDAS